MTTDRGTFDALVARALRTPGHARLRPAIEKELLHYDILFALERSGLLANLVFQGGTALRLCHGAPRLSEDLDFAGGRRFAASDLDALADCIERHVGKRYALDVHVKAPRADRTPSHGRAVTVDRWQVSIVTAPARPDLPRQRVRLEVANVPARTRELASMRANYDFLPDGYADTLLPVESRAEIMADKIVALVAAIERPRHRDLWDIPWLGRRGVLLDPALVAAKIEDYDIEDWKDRLELTLELLPALMSGEAFAAQMRRFLPDDVHTRTVGRPGFVDVAARELRAMLSSVNVTPSRDPGVGRRS